MPEAVRGAGCPAARQAEASLGLTGGGSWGTPGCSRGSELAAQSTSPICSHTKWQQVAQGMMVPGASKGSM